MKSAKAQLAGITLNHVLTPVYKKNTKKLLKYNLGDKDIALAILDPSTNQTVVTMGRLSGTKMVFPDPAVDVSLAKFNGVNSRFTVNKPAGGVVVALKYLLSKTDSGSKKAIEAGLSQAVYVPYSPDINSPEVIAYGQSYLNGVINQATAQLKFIQSSAIPGKLLTEAIPPQMIKALIYAEHTDSGTVLSGHAEDALNQLNILFATNEGDAYKYSVSNDGYASRGIAQFVQSTYLSLVQRHPEAGLMADYFAGMADHVNSVKAMYLLLDDYAGDVRIKGAQGFAQSRVFDYGVASYNAGTTRVAKAVAQYGDNWNQDRSGQVSALQSQVNSLASQLKSLKAKIKKTVDKKTKALLQSQLATAQANLSQNSSDLSDLQSSSLKAGTINYLTKIYKVISLLNSQQV